MIRTKEDLGEYLLEDSKRFQVQTGKFLDRLRWNLFSNPASDTKYIWKYIKTLRYLEYYTNTNSRWGQMYYSRRLRTLGYKTGFQIPPNVCGPGITIYHYGPIIINDKTRIGRNVVLYPGVLIGHKVPGQPAPIIGDNVFIGSGAKIIGDVHIGDNVVIAPNAVVVKDVTSNTKVGGVPAYNLK